MTDNKLLDNGQLFTFMLSNETYGIEISKVREVITLEPENIEPAPKIGTRLDTAFIKGMGKLNEEFVIVLDIEKIFTSKELVAVKEMNKE